jgi:hypothetical protein
MESTNLKNMKYYYCGLSHFLVAKVIMDIATYFLYMTIGLTNLNIYILPSVLAIFAIIIIYLFLFRQTAPVIIKPPVFILILLISTILSHILSQDIFLENYLKEDIALAYSIIKGLNILFILSFGVISYIKYYYMKE